MKCPHCLESFHPEFAFTQLSDTRGAWVADREGYWRVRTTLCPACSRIVVVLQVTHPSNHTLVLKEHQVWPKGVARAPLPPEIPERFAVDYREASIVLADSPKASAALSRRCLQHLLREKAGVKPSDLSTEIDEVLPKLPSYLAQAVDAIRNVGNFAAHPNKSTNSGEIIDVEPGEAEWLLDVLDGLFDFYFVQPSRLAAKRDALNQKLADAGKPPMKKPKS